MSTRSRLSTPSRSRVSRSEPSKRGSSMFPTDQPQLVEVHDRHPVTFLFLEIIKTLRHKLYICSNIYRKYCTEEMRITEQDN